MGKNKKPFFAKHAKSSAMLVSLIIHGIIVLVAVSFVAFTVINKQEKVFEAKEVKHPRMKLKKLQVPVKIEKRKKQTAKLRKRVVAKNTRQTTMDIQMPEITGLPAGLGAMDVASGIGTDIGFSMPEINFFGVKKKSEKVVFVVLAGPASTVGADGRVSPKSRMCFSTIRARLNDMVQKLPEYALFNATFFMYDICTPFSTNMLLATPENKQKLADWAAPVNPLELEETYGPGTVYEGFWERYSKMDWYNGDVMTNDVPPVFPKWVYNYQPGAHIMKHFKTGDNELLDMEFVHWNRAACFAFEQKPDAIFILTTNYIGEDPGVLVQVFMNICKDIYGPDRGKYPTINVVVLSRVGVEEDTAANVLANQYMSIINAFRGKGDVVRDIRDLMTPEEKAAMDKLPGTF